MNYAIEILGVVEPRLEAIESMKVREGGRYVLGEDYHQNEVFNGEEIVKWVRRDFSGWVEPTEIEWVIGLFEFEMEKAWDRFEEKRTDSKQVAKELVEYAGMIGWLEAQV